MAPERLCLLRQAHGLSKQDLAAAIGISASYLSLLESAKRHGSPAVLAKLAAYFRIDVALLFVPPPAPPASPLDRRPELAPGTTRGHACRPRAS